MKVYLLHTEVYNNGSAVQVFATHAGAIQAGVDLLTVYHADARSKEDLTTWLVNFRDEAGFGGVCVDHYRYTVFIAEAGVQP